MLTKNSYQAIKADQDTAITAGSGPTFNLLNLAPPAWTLPLSVTVSMGNKSVTTTWFKYRPPTGATFADAALLDSMRVDKDPALFKVLALYDSTGAELTSVASLTARYAAKPTSDSLPRNPWLRDYFRLPGVPEPITNVTVSFLDEKAEKASKDSMLGLWEHCRILRWLLTPWQRSLPNGSEKK